MYTIAADFESRATLAAALSSSGVFVPGVYYVPLGAVVAVRVTVRGLPGEIVLLGTVNARRLRGTQQLGLVAGVSVAPRGDQHPRFAFLRDWAAGTSEHSGRKEPRYPSDHPATLRALSASEPASARVTDVSAHGATITTTARITSGARVDLDVVFRGVPWTFPARVVWAAAGRAGLRLLLESPDEQLAWERVTESAREALFARLLAPGASGDEPQESPSRPPVMERVEPADGPQRSDRERAIETLQRILSQSKPRG